ncbi:hypothetical protein [Corynebacterium frankenforstense]|uniref:hypothetical protein n=1 Tax=Corynebacterium frankenforstense TaxID=1230998 RepID=UPI0009514BDE|nr:hypothetical protein [Corynebacterium frankenforstense]
MKLVSRTGLVAAATAVAVSATGLVAPAATAETTGAEGVVATAGTTAGTAGAGTAVRAADSGNSSKSEGGAGKTSSTSDNALTKMWNEGPGGKVGAFATVIGGMLGAVAVLALISRGLTELTKAIGK